MTPAVREMREAQAVRLGRLRKALDLSKVAAYSMAAVSRHAWRRMENGTANIDAVALALFCAKCEPPIPAEYVLSGNKDGLPEPLKDRLFEAERSAQVAPGAHSEVASDHRPSRSSPRKSKARTEGEAAPSARGRKARKVDGRAKLLGD